MPHSIDISGWLIGLPYNSNVDHLARALSGLVKRDPLSIKNQDYSVVTYWLTGKELLDAFTAVNGVQARLVDHPPEEQAKRMADIGDITAGAFGGIYFRHWEKEDLYYPNPIEDDKRKPLENLLHTFVKA